MDQRILVVDESELVCQQLGQLLNRPGRQVAFARDVTAALEWLVDQGADLVVADLDLPGLGGVELIREIDNRGFPTLVLALTGPAGIERGLAAMALGAYDLLVKPIDLERLEFLVEQALADTRLLAELVALSGDRDERLGLDALARRQPGLRPAIDCLRSVSFAGEPVMIAGAGPTEAGLLVRAVHAAGPRRHGLLQRIDGRSRSAPRAVGDLLAEATATNGRASTRRPPPGMHHGPLTLWLDGLDGLTSDDQASLASLLAASLDAHQSGGPEANVGLIATIESSPAGATCDGRLRPDLLALFGGTHVDIPPLGQRPGDVVPLAEMLLAELSAGDRQPFLLTTEAAALLSGHTWADGGESALRAVLARAVASATGYRIEPSDLPDRHRWDRRDEVRLDVDFERPLKTITDEIEAQIERGYLTRLLIENQGRIASSAAQAGLSRRSIHDKLTRYGIDKADYKPRPGRRRRPGQTLTGGSRRAGDFPSRK